MRTDHTGAIANVQQSVAFGDGFTQSSTDQYGAEQDNNQFTGQDRDLETNTTHFQFRQYKSTEGRWMSPDPYSGSYDFSNPQSFNRYPYVLNNPYSSIDPKGLVADGSCDDSNAPCYYSGQRPGDFAPGESGNLGSLDPWDNSYHGGLSADLLDGLRKYDQMVYDTLANKYGVDPPDNRSCAARLSAGVLKNTGTSITNIQKGDTIGGHTNYTFDVANPTDFQNILNNNPPFNLPFGIDKGYRYGTI